MINKYPSYCVAIRTLGTAGDKYLETLRSCERQTVKPEHIFVYIPYGYALPKETIGIEEYIRCDKGMVTQRSLPFDEISTEFILFLDDDLSFQENFVKKLFDGLIENNGDCISPDIYQNHKEKLIYKIRNYFGGTKPHWKKQWAFIIRKDSHYSYNNNPKSYVLKTQSGAGACCLCKKRAYNAIHFEDERWMEKYPYALGDDQLFYYKLYLYGYNLLTSYNAHITHLDAGAGHAKDKSKFSYFFSYLDYIIWKRSVCDTQYTKIDKFKCYFYYYFIYPSRSIPITLIQIIKERSCRNYIDGIKGFRDASSFVKSAEYLKIPTFLAHKHVL